MAWDDDELRKEALMRISGLETVGDTTGRDNHLRDMYQREYGAYEGQGVPSYEEFVKQYSAPQAPQQAAPNQKGTLERGASALYNALPDAGAFKSATDPFLKRKGLGR